MGGVWVKTCPPTLAEAGLHKQFLLCSWFVLNVSELTLELVSSLVDQIFWHEITQLNLLD